ncbi:hypothetical protein A0H81_10180 [Grifola frondosa]|uniref:Uncharacterized protein n=1 Tax=Grifola frondosa TaxID=5627 RepID=A0A1C7LZ67_GRIFR|nr:hypothetical protein A0H81_10180 [Grifola frondosa]
MMRVPRKRVKFNICSGQRLSRVALHTPAMFFGLIALLPFLILGKAVSANPLQARSSELVEVPHVVPAATSATTESVFLETVDLAQGHTDFTNAAVGTPTAMRLTIRSTYTSARPPTVPAASRFPWTVQHRAIATAPSSSTLLQSFSRLIPATTLVLLGIPGIDRKHYGGMTSVETVVWRCEQKHGAQIWLNSEHCGAGRICIGERRTAIAINGRLDQVQYCINIAFDGRYTNYISEVLSE